MARKFKIFRKTITQDSNCFFVAEIGANHCGNVETAKKLIDMCKLAGVNAVKFQKDLIKIYLQKKFTTQFMIIQIHMVVHMAYIGKNLN